MIEENKIDILIARYLSNELLLEEKKELEQWLAEDAEHVRYFTRCRNLHDLYCPAFPPTGIDEEKAYRNVDIRTGGKRLHHRKWWLTGVAAILGGFAIGMGWFYFQQNPRTDQTSMAQVVPAPTPSSEIILALPEGELIPLDSLSAKKEAATASINTLADKNGIAYAQADSLVPLQWHTWIIPRGKTFFLTLSDGTRVWMNAESNIRFPVEFRGSERKVFIEGEAYLEVTHNAQSPFRIETPSGEITVLGTEFNVRCYQGEEKQVTLVKGKVQVDAGDETLTLVPGEQATWNSQMTRLQKGQVNTALYCSWRDGKWLFENESLEEILKLVARRYDVQIQWKNEQLKRAQFSGEIRLPEKVEDVLKLLELADNLSLTMTGQEVEVDNL